MIGTTASMCAGGTFYRRRCVMVFTDAYMILAALSHVEEYQLRDAVFFENEPGMFGCFHAL